MDTATEEATVGEDNQNGTVEEAPDTLVLNKAREFKKAYRKMGASRPEVLAQARDDADALRQKVADNVNNPEAMNDAVKELRKADNRINRIINSGGEKRQAAIEALQALITSAKGELEVLEDQDV